MIRALWDHSLAELLVYDALKVCGVPRGQRSSLAIDMGHHGLANGIGQRPGIPAWERQFQIAGSVTLSDLNARRVRCSDDGVAVTF
jgi:hypothetical protein